jgi:hypothetical protein
MLIDHLLSEMTEANRYNDPLYYKVEKVNNTTGKVVTLYDLTTEEGHENRRECIRNGRDDIALLADMISLDEYSTLRFYARDDRYVITYSERWSRGSNTWATRLYFSNACNLRKLHTDITFHQVITILSEMYEAEQSAIKNIKTWHRADTRNMKTQLRNHEKLLHLLSTPEMGKDLIQTQPRLNDREVAELLTNKVRIDCSYDGSCVGLYRIQYDEDTQLYSFVNLNVI